MLSVEDRGTADLSCCPEDLSAYAAGDAHGKCCSAMGGVLCLDGKGNPGDCCDSANGNSIEGFCCQEGWVRCGGACQNCAAFGDAYNDGFCGTATGTCLRVYRTTSNWQLHSIL